MDIANKEYASNASNDYAFRNFFFAFASFEKKIENIDYNCINKHSWQIIQ